MRKPFESSVQDLVYNVDVGIGVRAIKTTLYFLFILSIMVVYTATQFRGLKDLEAMDYAQLGRNLMTQGQLITKFVRPASVWYLTENTASKDPRIMNHPDIMHPPLYPFVLANSFRVIQKQFIVEKSNWAYPPEQWVMIPFGHLCTILTGIFLFLLGKHLFDQRVALLGVTIFFLSDSVWRTSISGLNISLATLLATAAIYWSTVATSRHQDAEPFKRWMIPYLAAVVALILAFLTRYAMAILVPALALYIGLSFKEKGRKWALIFIALFIVGISPWLARNVAVSGGILGLAPYSSLNSDDSAENNLSFERSLNPTVKWGKIAPGLQAKWLTNMAKFYNGNLRVVGDGLLVCFFLTTFFYTFARENVRRLRWCLALGIILLLAVAAFFGETTARLLHIFWPLIILYSLAFFFILVDRLQLQLPLYKIFIVAVFTLLTALPLLLTLLPPRASVPYPPYFSPYISYVSQMLEPDELLCTDMPWATAWYGDRNSILLPQSIDEFYEINDYKKRVSGIYFTTLTRDLPYVRALLTGAYRTWLPILEGRIPADFPLTQGFPMNNLDQLFLTDRPRWKE